MPPTTPPLGMRADARRSYDAIVRAAIHEVAKKGADASLEEIARVAGVGSATLHRHFPSRWQLMQAVFSDQIATLCDRATALSADNAAEPALRQWLTELTVYAATTRGLARSLELTSDTAATATGSCEAMLADSGGRLLASAKTDGAVRGDVSIGELLALASAISSAAEGSLDPAATATRLLNLIVDGIVI